MSRRNTETTPLLSSAPPPSLRMITPSTVTNGEQSCFQDQSYDLLYKVEFFGPNKTGKTNIIRRLTGQEFELDERTTTGAGFSTVAHEYQGRKIKLQLWDRPNNRETGFPAEMPSHYRGAFYHVVVIDIARRSTLDEAKKIIERLKETWERNDKVVLVLNKIDLRHIRSIQIEGDIEPFVQELESKGLNVYVANVSALDGAGIQELKAFLGQDFIKCHIEPQEKCRIEPQEEEEKKWIYRNQLISELGEYYKDRKADPRTHHNTLFCCFGLGVTSRSNLPSSSRYH